MVFSSLAWREFEDALASQSRERSRVCILGRHLVPLRVTPIEPLSPEEQQQRQEQPPDPFMAQLQFEQRKSYYRSALTPRGLIDLDLPEDRWEVFVRDRSINHHVRLYSEQDGAADLIDVSGSCPDSMEANLRALRAFSRGFRFWHETLIVLLES
jgi:hypothetical protein